MVILFYNIEDKVLKFSRLLKKTKTKQRNKQTKNKTKKQKTRIRTASDLTTTLETTYSKFGSKIIPIQEYYIQLSYCLSTWVE